MNLPSSGGGYDRSRQATPPVKPVFPEPADKPAEESTEQPKAAPAKTSKE